MADDERKLGRAPALRERVHVRAAHAAVRDREFDVVVCERLWLEGGHL